jgi:hypothetical protein
MPVWTTTFKIKDLLSEDDDPAEVRRVALVAHERMVKERERTLRLVNAAERNPDIFRLWDDIADEFHSVAVMTTNLGGGDADWFNSILEELYDFGDAFRLWID